MIALTTKTFNNKQQFLVSIGVVLLVALIGLLIHDLVGYRVVAFLLLVTVSILAMFLEIIPVLVAAALSALIWDFFFIPPRYTLTVGTTDDRIVFVMYFLIAMINAAMTYKIRKMEKSMNEKDEKARSILFYNTLLSSLSHELATHQNESQYLRVFIAQLRKKIESDPNRPVHIITESGIGYQFIGNSTFLNN